MNNNDPTAEEMRAEIRSAFTGLCEFGEGLDFDTEAAIYWFANDWHGGQWSNLYSVLSMSPFHPGPTQNGPEEYSTAEAMLGVLVNEYYSEYYPVDLNETSEFM